MLRYFLYAGTCGSSGGSKPSSSSAFNGTPAGVTMRAVTNMIRFFLLCCSTLVRKALPTSNVAKNWDLILSFLHVFAHQPAEHHRLSIVNADARGHFACAEYWLVN